VCVRALSSLYRKLVSELFVLFGTFDAHGFVSCVAFDIH
jgi:hypothetical protein